MMTRMPMACGQKFLFTWVPPPAAPATTEEHADAEEDDERREQHSQHVAHADANGVEEEQNADYDDEDADGLGPEALIHVGTSTSGLCDYQEAC